MFYTKCKKDYVLLNNETFNNHFQSPAFPAQDRMRDIKKFIGNRTHRKTAACISYIFSQIIHFFNVLRGTSLCFFGIQNILNILS